MDEQCPVGKDRSDLQDLAAGPPGQIVLEVARWLVCDSLNSLGRIARVPVMMLTV